jgi:hypothetical protein
LLDRFDVFLAQPIQHPVGIAGENQRRVCLFTLGPLVFIIDQVPERDMPAALGKMQISRP